MNRRDLIRKFFPGSVTEKSPSGIKETNVPAWTEPRSERSGSLAATTTLRFLDKQAGVSEKDHYAGFRVGAGENLAESINAGITRNGYLFINKTADNRNIAETILTTEVRLTLTITPQASGRYFIKLKAFDQSGNTLATVSTEQEAVSWIGKATIVNHCTTTALQTIKSKS